MRTSADRVPEGATDYIDADMRDPDRIISHASGVLDFNHPIGLLFMGVLGHITDHDEAHAIVSHLLNALAPGSYLALNDGADTNEAFNRAQQSYDDTGAVPYRLRSPQQIAQFFDGLHVTAPGIVPIPQWRPDLGHPEAPQTTDAIGGVGRKP